MYINKMLMKGRGTVMKCPFCGDQESKVVDSRSIPQMLPLFMQNNSDDTNSIIPEQMKKYLLILLLTAQALTAGAQDYPEYQFSFGWGGYPAYE